MDEYREKTETECAEEDAIVVMREYDRVMDQVLNCDIIQKSEEIRRSRELHEQIEKLAGKELLSEYNRLTKILEHKRSKMLFRRAMHVCFSFLFEFLPTRHDDP